MCLLLIPFYTNPLNIAEEAIAYTKDTIALFVVVVHSNDTHSVILINEQFVQKWAVMVR